ncbi:alanine/glycine:cation symporter family protein [Candidatus Neptunochlamydia vexilliferae]|nr:sodium:alanine symporter family protein [Candidatus Neptunochlamydia vexilliferae]
MDRFEQIIDLLNNLVWGPPLIILLIAIGVYLTIRTRALQFRYLVYAHKLAFTRHDDNAQGDISHFQALMTALAATIGIGSITGVATAIAIGGLGALFWMWVAALVGMATKYGEAILAIKYRTTDENGEMCGGPMYYIERGMGWKWLAAIFAILGIGASFGIGNLVQSNSVSLAVQDLFGVGPLWTGIILMGLVGFALIGGIKSIGKIVGLLVPAMAVFYIIGGLLIIFLKIEAVPAAFVLIFRSAFSGQAATGGFIGATVMMAIQFGISRGVFSSEAGLGSSSIAAAAAQTDTPGRQALVSMCSVFITTGIVCTITGLVIAVSGVLGELGPDGQMLDGSAMALRAFDSILPYGGLIVTIALIPFAYSTILGWAYYGEKCIEYLCGIRTIKVYRVLFTLLVFPGAFLSMKLVWNLANMLNGLMAFPNLIALFALTGVIAKETRFFEGILKKEKLARKKNR